MYEREMEREKETNDDTEGRLVVMVNICMNKFVVRFIATLLVLFPSATKYIKNKEKQYEQKDSCLKNEYTVKYREI